MRFGEAMNQVFQGMHLRRTGWPDSFGHVFRDTALDLVKIKNDASTDNYTWNYYPTQADMRALDWEIVVPGGRPTHPPTYAEPRFSE